MGSSSAKATLEAVALVISESMKPQAAADSVGVHVTTVYRNKEYKAWNEPRKALKKALKKAKNGK